MQRCTENAKHMPEKQEGLDKYQQWCLQSASIQVKSWLVNIDHSPLEIMFIWAHDKYQPILQFCNLGGGGGGGEK